jgi:Kef-type K+ transport system membrane component KefB
LDLNKLKELGRTAVITIQVSIVLPFALGSLLAYQLYPKFSNPGVSFLGFALFMGSAMSVTAFPVLAPILSERNLLRTRVGSVAITCAAVNDVTAWCILAAIIVIVSSSTSALPLWLMASGLVAFLLLMLYVVRRLLRKLVALYERHGVLTQSALALVLLVALASGWTTELLGVHALFGAFVAGVIMPRHSELTKEMMLKMEPLITVLLLPLYFAFTGLRTSFSLISGAEMWLYCLLVIALAVVGKLVGSMLSTRMNGMSWRESAAVGVLMNTRGLVELVILNIGLDLGVLSPALFSIMVLMALATTLMTPPLLNLILRPVSSKLSTVDAGRLNLDSGQVRPQDRLDS